MTFMYHSTRGSAPELDFRGVTMAGLASDGGLYVPKVWPRFTHDEIAAMRGASYQEVALRVMRPFVAGTLDDAALRGLIDKAYSTFSAPEITPLVPMPEPDRWLLELFHGPTLAFKDVALQFLGHLFEHFLAESGERMTVIGATSGDTGSAAIMATANRKNVETFILFPDKGPSDIQRKQMTCVDAPNVHAIAVRGSFDDCQSMVKTLFGDAELRAKHNLAAVNSINWARILAQIVYYFYAATRLGAPDAAVNFVVPTGNFGNVYAAYAARRCGLPIAKLGVASNRNDILTRFFKSGVMEVGLVASTLSPSMDIQISSNFERLLFDLCHGDSGEVRARMTRLKNDGQFAVSSEQLAAACEIFVAARVDDEQTLETIRDVHAATGMILDPHTAVGVCGSRMVSKSLAGVVVTLACAHSAKFPEVIRRAIGIDVHVPDEVASLLRKPERMTVIAAEVGAVVDILAQNK